MSQPQPRRPEAEQEPIKYGDVFPVSGELSDKPIAPQDAAAMQSAESMVMGRTQKGGPAAVMQSAATENEKAGVVGHTDVTDDVSEQGVTVVEVVVPGEHVVAECVAGQVIGQYAVPDPSISAAYGIPAVEGGGSKITVGEALEATALAVGDKPVNHTDAAAIQAAEVRATGRNAITPGGVASKAQSAATINDRTMQEEDKTKLSDVLTDASEKLPGDKVATPEDAVGVIGAELRNNPNMTTYPGGVAESVAAAAKINQRGA